MVVALSVPSEPDWSAEPPDDWGVPCWPEHAASPSDRARPSDAPTASRLVRKRAFLAVIYSPPFLMLVLTMALQHMDVVWREGEEGLLSHLVAAPILGIELGDLHQMLSAAQLVVLVVAHEA